MADRERKRAERRKRKARSASAGSIAADGGPASGGDAAPDPADRMRKAYAKAELKNEAVRESLDPLDDGERPRVITIGAFVSGAIATIFFVSAIIAASHSVEVSGKEPDPVPLAAFGVIMAMMAYGLWRTRYWAALGFQLLLVIFLLAAAGGLVQVRTPLQALGTTVILAGSGTLFYFMVKAMARIQMPTADRR